MRPRATRPVERLPRWIRPAARKVVLGLIRGFERMQPPIAVLLAQTQALAARMASEVSLPAPQVAPLGNDRAIAFVTHHRSLPDPARERWLGQVVGSLLELPVPTCVVVVTNDADGAMAALRSQGFEPALLDRWSSLRARIEESSGATEVLVIGWRGPFGRRHGYYLAWAHKKGLRIAARTNQFSLYLYLEDDVRITGVNLELWRRFRGPLARQGMIPGFLTFEQVGGTRYSVADVAPLQVEHRVGRLDVDGLAYDLYLAPNPYQPFHIMDHAIAVQHLRRSPMRSPLRSLVIRWPIRERAAAGPIFDDRPPFAARNVLLVRRDLPPSAALAAGSMVEHLPGNYARDATSPNGKVRLSDLFPEPSSDGES